MLRTFSLPPSRTHAERFYLFDEVAGDFADGYMTIQQGVPGPRGGTAHIDVESYYVQEHQQPPDERVAVIVLLLKDNVTEPDVYQVVVPPLPERVTCCCTGYHTTGNCKHCDAVGHLVRVVGWEGDACGGS